MNRSSRRTIRRIARKIPVPERFWAAVKRVLQLDDTRESLALGVAVGIFIAFTPTVGIQMILVAIIHTLIRANRLAGIAMVWISNPFTVVPIYWCDYLVGRWVLGSEKVSYERFAQLFDLQAEGFISQFVEFTENLRPVFGDVAIPLCLGGAIVGVVLAVPAYPLTLKLVDLERRGRRRLDDLRALRRQRQDERTARTPAADAPVEAAPASSCDDEREANLDAVVVHTEKRPEPTTVGDDGGP